MSAKKFKSGDVVCLKSGGPLMTIRAMTDYEPVIVSCTWFNGLDGPLEGHFIVSQLDLVRSANESELIKESTK